MRNHQVNLTNQSITTLFITDYNYQKFHQPFFIFQIVLYKILHVKPENHEQTIQRIEKLSPSVTRELKTFVEYRFTTNARYILL